VIAPTLSETREAAEIEEAGVTFVVSLPRLYAGYTHAIKKVLAGGEIGEPTYLRVRVSHDGALPSEESPLGWLPERFFDPRQSAGGVTIDFGAHPLYLLAHLLGMPEEVSAAYGRFTGRAVEDHSVVAMGYPNGALGVAEASFLGTPPLPFLWRRTAPRGVSSMTRAAASGRAAGAPSDGAPSECPPTEGRPSGGGWLSPRGERRTRRTSGPHST
jgi:predicted dehydrogenase